MAEATDEAKLPIWARLWRYQAERFPLAVNVPLIAVFAAAAMSTSQLLTAKPGVGIGPFLAATVVGVLLFFQLRVADEIKDEADDRQHRPERPVPRGLISLKLLVRMSAGAAVLEGITVGLVEPRIFLILMAVWLWLALMSEEFNAPQWLKARPIVYLVSHMLIMPLIALLLSAHHWLTGGHDLPPGIGLFLWLAFLNGCVLEFGRKIWAPENERPGVETYSALWGPGRATLVWLLTLINAALVLAGLTLNTGVPGVGVFVAILGIVGGLAVALMFRGTPTTEGQKTLETLSGAWVLLSYLGLAAAPWLDL